MNNSTPLTPEEYLPLLDVLLLMLVKLERLLDQGLLLSEGGEEGQIQNSQKRILQYRERIRREQERIKKLREWLRRRRKNMKR